jgi:tetratricopeptide (TPR) repeat protein
MDIDKAFENIQLLIKDERYGETGAIIDAIVSSTDDVHTLIKCASLLKVTEDEDGCQDILDDIVEMDIPSDERMTVAMSLRGLGRPEEAYGMMEDEKENDVVLYEKARTLLTLKRGDEALRNIERTGIMNIDRSILLCEIYCSLKRYDDAHELALKLVDEDSNSYRSLVNLCSVLMLTGKEKEAIRTAKQYMKDGKDADSLALGAYVMRISGRIPAAANYAHKALTKDHTHKGALETMAYCLIEKSRFIEAKVVAGAINERSPGDPAAIRILDACRRS